MSPVVAVLSCLVLVVTLAACGSRTAPAPPSPPPTPPSNPQPPTTEGDAFIQEDPAAQTWTIGNSRIRVTFGLTSARDMVLQSVTNPTTNRSLTLTRNPDSTVAIDGRSTAIGAANSGLTFAGAEIKKTDLGVELAFTYNMTSPPVTVVRHYACYPGVAALEAWNTYKVRSTTRVTIANQEVWHLTMTTGQVHHVTGLRGDQASDEGPLASSTFTLQTSSPGSGDRWSIGSTRRSSEQDVPVIMIDSGASDEFFGALLWSGSWQMAVEPGAGGRRVVAGIPGVSITIDETRELSSPHGLFGFVPGRAVDVSAALHRFIDVALRRGRPFEPLVTYNTWFAYGTDITEESIKREMEGAAALQAELFVVDAGWYRGAGANGPYDFSSGVGSLRPDPDRFPSGLRHLRDYAHSLGLKFGIWVEPERTALSRMEDADAPADAWLAKRDNRFDPDVEPDAESAAQICLGSEDARRWLLEQLSAFLDEVQPDYLKWDNNFWINCNRGGHGHGTTDGNYAHVEGLYWLLDELRYRYPTLMIENVAGGGTRLDLGMMRFTDTAWMDDRTVPSPHVRHNLEGLSTIFPPAYLLSFLVDSDEEPLHEAFDMPLYMRSRMPGILGLTVKTPEYSAEDQQAMRDHVGFYRSIKDIIQSADARLLSRQVNSPEQPAWDVLQHLSANGDALLFAFQMDGGTPSVRVQPVGLTKDAIYSVTTPEGTLVGQASGADLAADGIEIVESWVSSSHVLVLRVNVEATRKARASRAERLVGGGRQADAPARRSEKPGRAGGGRTSRR